MDTMAAADGFDQYDCLFCKRVPGCSYGRAFLERAGFSYLSDSCFEHDPSGSEEPVSAAVGERRVEVYGAEPWDDIGL
jgi:hypothetical protein